MLTRGQRIARGSVGKRLARKPVVYFIECEGFVKIGTGFDAKERLDAFRVGCPFPMTLLGYIEGDRWTEKTIHARFKDLRHTREWFTLNDALREFISQNVSAAADRETAALAAAMDACAPA